MKTIKLKAKNVYGNVQHYPDCDLSTLIAKCTGQKTITERQQSILKDSGYEIEVTAAI